MSDGALARLQQRFMQRLLDVPDDALDEEIATGRMSREVGLRIYTHAYRARLREALDNDHPVLGLYLGDDLWHQLCAGYITAHPSRHRSLRDFGVDLPAWLAQAEPFATHPLIAELATFERLLLDSFDAADADLTDWPALLAIPGLDWPGLTMRFHPSLRRFPVACNSVESWRALKEGGTPPTPGPAAHPEWVLWRDDDRVSRFRSLDASERAALAHCQSQGDFAGLCEVLLEWHAPDAVPAVALGHLQTWCGEGWISRWN